MDDTQKKGKQDSTAEEGLAEQTEKEMPVQQAGDDLPPDVADALTDAPVDEDSSFLQNNLSENEGYTSQFGDLVTEEEDALTGEPGTVKTKKKKKRLLMPSIIIAIIIFVIAAAAGAVYIVFFADSPVGVWQQEAQEGQAAASYYIFDDEGGVSLVSGTVAYKGTYSFTEATGDTARKITLHIPVGYTAISGDFNYTITGNTITGKSFVISDENGSELKLHSAALPENTLKPATDRKTDDKMIGTWKAKDGGYDITYCFHTDGTMYMESSNMRIDAVYTLADGKIETTYSLSGQEGTMEEDYSFDGDTLIISDIGYEKVE